MRKIVSFLAAKYIYIILLLLFISHLPFLNADPDSLADINTRGAWTDEGLYTSQIRNWINHYPFSMTENTVFVRGPLYNIIQIPFFAIFGTKLIVSRLITLMIIMISVFMLTRIKEAKTTALMLIFTTFTQFHIFQFSHYGLSEMECICYVMLSMFFLVKYYERIENGKWRMENRRLKYLFLSAMFVAFAYYSKIQYLYVMFIPIVTVILIKNMHALKTNARQHSLLNRFLGNAVISMVIFTVFFFALYYLLDFYPYRNFYKFIMEREVTEKIPDSVNKILGMINFNLNYCIYTKYLLASAISFVCLLPIGIFLLKTQASRHKHQDNNQNNTFYKVAFIFSLFWVLAELHKLTFTYLPMRYLLSLIFSLGLFASVILGQLSTFNKPLKFIISATVFIYLLYNINFNYKAYQRRTYDLRSANNYLSHYNLENKLVLGSWAPSATWKTKAKTIPIWNKYINWEKPIENYHPVLVIGETDDDDSENAFKDQKINLNEISDSVKVFNIWRYKVGFYWIKK